MVRARTQSRIVEIVVLIGTLGIVPHAPLASQQLGSTFDLEDRQAAVGRVPIGKIIRLRLSDGGRAAGPVRRWDSLAGFRGPHMGDPEQSTVGPIWSIDTPVVPSTNEPPGATYGGA